MAGESFLSPSYYLGAASQLGTQAVSGASGFLGGVANTGAGFLSSISQQPQYPTPVPPPSYTPPAPQSPTLSALSGRTTGSFGTGVDTSSMFRSPSPSSSISAPDFLGMASGGLSAAGGFLGGLFNAPTPNVPPSYQGNVPTGGALNLPGASNVEALKSPAPTRVSGLSFSAQKGETRDLFGTVGDRLAGLFKPSEPVPPVSAMTQEKATGGIEFAPTAQPPSIVQAPTQKAVNFVVPGELAKPAESYLSSISGYTPKVGDSKTADLIKTGSAVATWTGSPEKVNIVDARDALEFQRQQALASGDTRAARYYANELDKAAQNDIRLSSQYHYEAKRTGLRQEANPYENLGDAALAFLKGGNAKDDFAKNYAFNPSVTGPTGVLSLLPGGRGTQERDWSAALKGKAAPDTIENFLPAIASWRAAGGTMGPYGSLGSRDQTGKFVPVPAENIAKMPDAFRLALADIGAGKTIRPTATYNLPGGGPAAIPTTQVAGTGTARVEKTSGILDVFKEPNAAISSLLGVQPVGAAETGTGGIEFVEGQKPAVTPQPQPQNNWFFGMDLSKGGVGGGVAGIGTMLSSTFNPQAGKEAEKLAALQTTQDSVIKNEYIPTINSLIASGADVRDAQGNKLDKVTVDNASGIRITYNKDNPTQVALNTQLETVIAPKIESTNTAVAQQAALTKATETDESKNAFFGIIPRFTKQVVPTYEEGFGGVMDTFVKSVNRVTHPGVTEEEQTRYYQQPGKLLPSEALKVYLGGEKGYTKEVFDPVAGKFVTQTFTAPEGAFRDVIYPFAKSFIENPREHPVEFVTMAAAAPAFEGVGQIGAGLASKAALQTTSPLLARAGTAALESTALKTATTVGTTGLLGTMVVGEGAKVKGYDFNPLNIAFGKPVIERTVTGYDEQGKPIYAEQTAAATSARAGEATSNILSMGLLGMPTASRIKLVEGSPALQPSKMSLSENVKSKLIDLLDRPTISNKEALTKIETTSTKEGLLTRAQPTKEIPGVNIVGAIPSGTSVTAKAAEIVPGKIDAGLFTEADTTIARAALRATNGPNGEVRAIVKGSPATGTLVSGEVTPGTEGGIRTAIQGLVKDLDIEAVNPVTYAKDVAKLAQEDLVKSYEERGISQVVKVEPYYEDGYILNIPRLGPRNPYNVEFKVKIGESPAQVIPNSKLDLKLYGMGSPKLKGEGVINYYNFVRTPNYEQTQPFVGVGTWLFGSPNLRGRAMSDLINTKQIGQDEKISILNLGVAKNEKFDNIETTLKTGTRAGKDWNPEVEKLPKSLYDYVAIGKEQQAVIDARINSGMLKGKDLTTAQNAKSALQKDMDNLLDTTVQIRPSADAEIQTVRLGDLYNVRAQEVQAKADAFGRPQTYNIDLTSPRYQYQRPFTGASGSAGVSAVGITPAGLTTVRVSEPSAIGKGIEVGAGRGGVSGSGISAPSSGGKLSSGSKSSGISSGIGSSGISKISSAPSTSVSLPSSFSKAISESISPPSSKGSSSKGSSGPSPSSSFSVSSLSSSYSSSVSSPSMSPSSGSSSSSYGSMGGPGAPAGGGFGIPFLAPPGGGGGGGGGRGRGNIVIKNPLSALRVASGKAFKNMFDFTVPNKLASDVSKNLKQTQPYGTSGATADYSRGVSASIKEATGAARKPKKSSPKMSLVNTNMKMPKISIPDMHLEKSSKKKGKN